MVKIGLLGIGTVGSGVYEILNSKTFKNSIDENITISKILVRNINKERDSKYPKDIFTDDPNEIIDNPEIDIVIEVMGGINPAYKYINKALNNKKHVVTANKELVSIYLDELSEKAYNNNLGFLFEASVAGGIPIIKPLTKLSKINDIKEIKGILNGTTNFILTKMIDENLSFDDALSLAKDLGYAEADPTNDIEGFDVLRKLAILSTIAFKSKIELKDILCRGIKSIKKEDIIFFKKLRLKIKLVANAIKKDNKFSSVVEPMLVNENSTLSTVKDAFNIVSVTGNQVGELNFYGQGAGKSPTANAVISDVVDIINNDFDYSLYKEKNISSVNTKLFSGRYYIRISEDIKNSEVFNRLKKFNIKYEILNNEDLALVTEHIPSNVMEDFIRSMDFKGNDFCYVRIDGALKNMKSKEAALTII
ncbi:MAG: homoserine dehydrogenase [Firmicutes bacterium]|nr:homoserine dehydrogenase [Bacillota bacterium]